MNSLTEKFFRFELENKLFDIIDENGMRVWDVIRSTVYVEILRRNTCNEVNRNDRRWILLYIKFRRLWKALIYYMINWNKDYFFYLYSRSYKDGVYFDKVSDALVDIVGVKNAYIIESYNDICLERNYKYGNVSPLEGLFARFVRKRYDMTYLLHLLENSFPDVSFDPAKWQKEYIFFYASFRFYCHLFRVKKVKTAFMIMNGYQNGMFAAAKKTGVSLYELQHGEITRNHMCYSYPEEDSVMGKIYSPTTLLTLGRFWMHDCIYPGVDVKVIGNNFYSKEFNYEELEPMKDILVVSSIVHGYELSRLVRSVCNNEIGAQIRFYYKLHPSEEHLYDYYVREFDNLPNVEVIPGSNMIMELLSKVSFILTIQSTVEFEALTMGVKVMIYKRLDFDNIDSLFEEDGVYLINNENDLLTVYQNFKNLRVHNYGDYFFRGVDSIVVDSII